MVDQLPKNVSLEALALSPAEQRAFPRWYTDLLLRKRTDSITIGDVMSFVDNFGVTRADKSAITGMFGDPLVTLDPPQFYVFLRLTGHVLQGKILRRELAFVAAPVPRPRSILSSHLNKSHLKDKSGQEMDLFMSLMTGNGGGGIKKRKKRVTFDSKPPQVTEAAHRSMEELLRQSQIQSQLQLAQPQFQTPHQQNPDPRKQSDSEPEPDQPIANNQFARVNIDSVLHHGQSMLPEPPAPRKAGSVGKAGDSFIQQLTQNTQQQPQQQPQQLQQPQLQQQQPQLQPPPSQSPQHSGSQNYSLYPAPPPRRPSLGPQHSGLQPQSTGGSATQFLSPQVSGLSSQNTGPQFLSPQSSGIHQQQQPQKLGPQSTGSLPMNMHRNIPPPPPPNRFHSPTHQTMLQPPSQVMNQSSNQASPQMAPQVAPQMTSRIPSPMQLQLQSTGIQPQGSGIQAGPQQNFQPGFQPGFQSSFQPGYQPAMQGLHPGLASQSTGFQPNAQPGLTQQGTGMYQPAFQNGMQNSMQNGLQTGVPNGMPNGMSNVLQAQPSGIQPQLSGYSQQQPIQQTNTGMQFINSLQAPAMSAQNSGSQNAGAQNTYPIAPPPQYVRNQAYNMQGLREQLPNW